MKKQAGLWIDHREAIIVMFAEGVEDVRHVNASNQKHIRYSGSSHDTTPEGLKEVTSEDSRDRKFMNNLNNFYDEVIAVVREADAIHIFGPGEAKGELEKRFEHAGLLEHVRTVEPADKLSKPQIVAKARECFTA